MEKKRWEEAYPNMPESFHLAVLEAVNHGTEEETGKKETVVKKNFRPNRSRKVRKKKILLLAAAAVLVCGGFTAAASRRFDFKEYLGIKNQEAANEAFQSNIEVTVEEEPRLPEFVEEFETEEEREEYISWVESRKKRENNAQLMDIREVMFDGMRLSIYGVPTEEGKKYRLGGTDRLYINGKEAGPVENWNNEGNKDVYTFTVDVEDLNLQVPFEVTLPVNVSGRWDERYESQDLTFVVDTDAVVTKLPDQSFKLEEYTVEVTELRKSLTSIRGKVSVIMTEEQEEAYGEGKWVFSSPVYKDKKETELKILPLSFEEDQKENDDPKQLQWYFHRQIPDKDMDSMMLYLRLREKAAREDAPNENAVRLEKGIEVDLTE